MREAGLVLVCAAVFIGAVLLLTNLLVSEQSRIDSFVRQCHEQGGHIYMPSSTGWCLDDEGRFIEVYP